MPVIPDLTRPEDRSDHYYSETARWWGNSTISDQDRERARTVARLCGDGQKRVLDLGAGFGGTAAAIAEQGHSVVAVELNAERICFAREHTRTARPGSLTVLEGDFYTAQLEGRFDVVCYWNGFGIGSDADQRRLLRRVRHEWLSAEGAVLLNVFNPHWWIRKAGTVQAISFAFEQGFDFDPVASRFINHWWPRSDASRVVSESIRCYSPMDFLLLLEGTGLRLDAAEVDGHSLNFDQPDETCRKTMCKNWKYLAKLAAAA